MAKTEDFVLVCANAGVWFIGCFVRFFCYWVNERGDRVPDMPGNIRTMMETTGGTVEIDEYR
ncbi:hypothetical protein F3J19_02115 [Burkholderia sp. Ax-1724]|nr:hypothetical protein [Burkholderia sp. Ax-1724]